MRNLLSKLFLVVLSSGVGTVNVFAESPSGSPSTSPTSSSSSQSEIHKRIFGTWAAKNVETKGGTNVDIELTFKEEGPLKLLAWSDVLFVGQVRNKKAPYRIEGNAIISDAIPLGTNVNFHFSPSGSLIIEYKDSKTVRFHHIDSRSKN